MSALFIAPITFWVTTRSTTLISRHTINKSGSRSGQFVDSEDDFPSPLRSSTPTRRPLSPTVALLENGRQVKKIRTSSVHR